MWRECIETAIFVDSTDARTRIGHFIDYYNFQRTHQGIKGLVPADRFFEAAPYIKDTLKKRVDANALTIAKNGIPKDPFYITGKVGGKSFSVHAEGERMILTPEDGQRRQIDLVAPGDEQPAAPGVSPLDGGMKQIIDSLQTNNQKETCNDKEKKQ